MTPDLIRRQEATNHTLRKYRRKDFDWVKRVNCVPMAWFHLRRMGHTPPPLPPFRSPIGAPSITLSTSSHSRSSELAFKESANLLPDISCERSTVEPRLSSTGIWTFRIGARSASLMTQMQRPRSWRTCCAAPCVAG